MRKSWSGLTEQQAEAKKAEVTGTMGDATYEEFNGGDETAFGCGVENLVPPKAFTIVNNVQINQDTQFPNETFTVIHTILISMRSKKKKPDWC